MKLSHLVGDLLQIVLLNQLKGGAFVEPELLVQHLKQQTFREDSLDGRGCSWSNNGLTL